MTESPSLLLQRAATRLEELTRHTTPLRWGEGSELTATLKILGADAEWIATMSPAVAAPLANILRYEARTNGSSHRGDLIAVARAVLGVPSKEEE